MEEVWKQIPGYEGLYDASSFGRIRSSPGKVTSSKRFAHREWKPRIMKTKHPINAKRHDERVTLWKDGKPSDHLVSRLIAMAWLGIPKGEMTVNHIDGNYLNNAPSNLEWITLSDNIQHGFRTGLYSSVEKPIGLIDSQLVLHKFQSESVACRFLGRNHTYINMAKKRQIYDVTDCAGKRYRIIPIDKDSYWMERNCL